MAMANKDGLVSTMIITPTVRFKGATVQGENVAYNTYIIYSLMMPYWVKIWNTLKQCSLQSKTVGGSRF